MSLTHAALVEVSVEACSRIATLIRKLSVPADKEVSLLPGFSKRQVGNFYLFLVAICHQTSPHDRPALEGMIGGRRLRGWDYLSACFESAARADLGLLAPESWTKMRGDILAALYRDPVVGDRLSDPNARAELVRDLGRLMAKNGWRWLDDLYSQCGCRIASGNPNLIQELAEFRAYQDPVKKKSFFLLSLMRNSGLWRYADDEQLRSPVDYHEVRGHLRLGTVVVNDQELRGKLRDRVSVTPTEDVAIREATVNAIMLLTELTGIPNPSQLHYLFWNVFRSCCTRESPHCEACPDACALPDRYVPLAVRPDGLRHCPFAEVCGSAGSEKKLLEHVFETDYY